MTKIWSLLPIQMIEKKGMTFGHDLDILFPLSLPSYKRRDEEKENEKQKS
jgi:hypothetical protein